MWKGSTVTCLLTGRSGVVGKTLGEGTYGRVSELRYSDGAIGAVKLLKLERSQEKEEQIAELCRRRSPHANFVGWPVGYGRTPEGLIYFFMEKVPGRFRHLKGYFAGKVALTPRAVVRIGFNLAESFAALHLAGMVFNDISRNQLLISRDGEIAIVDCDNICFASAARVVRGTRGYMTPKLERGEEAVSTATDAYALGVLLFELFIWGNPLSGMKESTMSYVDDALRDTWYKTSPLFVFSESDRSNRPDPTTVEGTMLERWRELPEALQDFFRQDFEEGLANSADCVLETEWREHFGRLEDSLFECRNRDCRQPLYYDANLTPFCCPHCDVAQTPSLLHIYFDHSALADAEFTVAVGNDTRLYAHHLQRTSGFDHTPAARIVRGDRTDPRFVGLQNLTREAWRFRERSGAWRRIRPQETAPLPLGATIHFPRASAVLM